MNSLFWLFTFAGLFVGICMFVVMAIAIYNILSKSYKPRNSLIIILVTGLIFFSSGFFALSSLNKLIGSVGLDSGLIQEDKNIDF